MDCVICARLRAQPANEEPIGGYVYEDEHWIAYHAPCDRSVLGQLFVVSRRHFLDFAEMTESEAASYGQVLRKLYGAMKHVLGAERVYSLITLEGVPHFHVWLIPRTFESLERGWDLIYQVMKGERSCLDADACEMVAQLRVAIG